MGIDNYYYDFVEAREDNNESEPDSYFLEAQRQIREIYEKDKESVYYLRQMQVKLEGDYFHWITNNAMIGLLKLGFLIDIRMEREGGTGTRYFIHKSNRYPRRRIKRMEKLVQEYSADTITRSCGHRAEDLFCSGLALRGFIPKAKKVKSYGGVTWERSGHDLDFVFERDGIAYGCEIKNTLGYIQKEEMVQKLDMCEHLGLKPLFIMRWSPKTYNKIIIDRGGYVMIFVAQIYEMSQAKLVETLKTGLVLPVDCPKAIPEGILKRFENWHNKTCELK